MNRRNLRGDVHHLFAHCEIFFSLPPEKKYDLVCFVGFVECQMVHVVGPDTPTTVPLDHESSSAIRGVDSGVRFYAYLVVCLGFFLIPKEEKKKEKKQKKNLLFFCPFFTPLDGDQPER